MGNFCVQLTYYTWHNSLSQTAESYMHTVCLFFNFAVDPAIFYFSKIICLSFLMSYEILSNLPDLAPKPTFLIYSNYAWKTSFITSYFWDFATHLREKRTPEYVYCGYPSLTLYSGPCIIEKTSRYRTFCDVRGALIHTSLHSTYAPLFINATSTNMGCDQQTGRQIVVCE